MIKKRDIAVFLSLLLGIILIGSCTIYVLNSGKSATARLNHLAQLAPNTPFDPGTARMALLRVIPPNSTEAEIYAFLDRHGAIGQDSLSLTPIPVLTPNPHATFPVYVAQLPSKSFGPIIYYPKDNVGVIHCFISSDQFLYSGGLYYVRFWLDDQEKLRDITVVDDSRSL
jgi:hypothetical protein